MAQYGDLLFLIEEVHQAVVGDKRQRERLVHIAVIRDIAVMKVQQRLEVRLGFQHLPGAFQHHLFIVDAVYGVAGLRQREHDAPRPAADIQQRSAVLFRELQVERDVVLHVGVLGIIIPRDSRIKSGHRAVLCF